MTYNILNYRNFTSYCTSSNNNPVAKEAALREVVQYLQPDLLVCNEVGGATPSAHEKILTDVLNTNGVNRWASTSYTNNGFSTLVNGIYYDKNKLGVKREQIVTKTLTSFACWTWFNSTTRIRCWIGTQTPPSSPWWART